MLNRLRIRFVSIAALTLLACLTIVITTVYILTDNIFEEQINTMINILLEHNGEMPEGRVHTEGAAILISDEIQFETRYFTVKTDSGGGISQINTSHVFSIDNSQAGDIARAIYRDSGAAKERNASIGQLVQELFDNNLDPYEGRYHYNGNMYYYSSRPQAEGGRLYVFVDVTSRYYMVQQIYSYIFMVSGCILLAFTVIFILLSQKVIEPFMKNQERQKRFITNASHELKTPLTVISANTEMIEMTGSKSKWTESTKRQTQKMSQLVSNLVTLSKLDEKDEVVLSKVNASKIVSDQAEPFTSVIESSGRKFETQITPDLLIRSESRGVQELVSILLDNAAKYCDEEGRIFLKFEAVGKPGKDGLTGAKLSVTNSYKNGVGVDYRKFFERFYREDESHNSKKSGFGIGLSIASELCTKIGARINATYDKNAKEITFIIQFR